MKPQKIFFAANIKFLRERKKMSQEALAQKLGLTRAKLAALETQQTKAPQPEDFINFSEFFKISIDSLLKVELARLSELKIRELEAGNDVYMMGSKIRVLAITVDEKNKENLEFVPIKAKAGYSAGYNDPEYIASLPKFTLPNLPKSSTFRMFPTIGDSMLPIPEGSEVIGSYIEDWKSIKPKTPCIVILKGSQDFVFKEVSVEEKALLLASFNPSYQPYQVPIEEVLEIWKFYKYQTGTLPEPQTDMQQLFKMMREMQEELKLLKK